MITTQKSVRWSVFPIALAGLFLSRIAYADTTINLAAGYLRQNATTALNSTNGGGGLLLLVAAGGNNGTTFNNSLPPNQYVAGGDVIVSAAFGFNTNGGMSTGANTTGGETQNPIIVPTSVYSSVAANAYLELCWFPTITLAQYNSGVTPAAGTLFGAYNPKLINPNQSLDPDGGNNWVLPGDGGGTIKLNFFTSDDQNGSQAISEGFGDNFMVVPEPANSGLFAGAFMGLIGLRAWYRGRKAS